MRLVEAEVIGIICDRLKKVGELNPTSARQLAILAKDYNADMREIQKVIQKRMNLSAEEVERIFQQAAKDSTELATALAMDRLNVVDTKRVEEQASAAAARYKDQLLNLPDTFAFKMGEGYKPLREAYIAVTNKATLAVHSGALDYNTAIRQEVKRLADHGISVVEWESGYHRRLDSSVRMNVLEGVRQMNQEILQEAGEKFATGYEISAHDRPAPDHADIQGRQYTKEEYEKLNASLKRPIGTLNCMHIAYPIIYGVTKPTYSEKELEEMKEHAEQKYHWKGKELTGYECTQEQRRMETEIRKSQDKERAFRRAGDTVGADREKERTQRLRKEYKEFSEHVGLKEKLNRTGRANSSEAAKRSNEIVEAGSKTKNNIESTPDHTPLPYPATVEDLHEYNDGENTYVVDGEHVVLDYTSREKRVGEILSRELREKVYMAPKVYQPEHISTPDYITESGVKYDVKEIFGNGKNTLASAVQKKMRQSSRFILDIKDECLFTDERIKQDIIRIISNQRTAFIKEIWVVRGDTVIIKMKKS